MKEDKISKSKVMKISKFDSKLHYEIHTFEQKIKKIVLPLGILKFVWEVSNLSKLLNP